MAQRKKKTRKVADVARELKIQTPTIISFLEEKGYEVKRGINQPVTDEMYMILLKKFDYSMFQKLQSEQASLREQSHKREANKIRAQDKAELLAARHAPAHPGPADETAVSSTSDDQPRDTSGGKPKKILLPQRQALKIVRPSVEPDGDKPKTADAPVQVEETPTPQPTTPDEPVSAETPKKKAPPKKGKTDGSVRTEPKKKSARRRKKKPLKKTADTPIAVETAPTVEPDHSATKEERADILVLRQGPVEQAPVEQVEPAPSPEEVKPRKIELPKRTPLVIVKPAPEPPAESEKPKRKRRSKSAKRTGKSVPTAMSPTGKPSQGKTTSVSKTKESAAERKPSRRKKTSVEQRKRSQAPKTETQPSAEHAESPAKKKPRRKKALPKTGTRKGASTEVIREKIKRVSTGKKDERTETATETPKKRSRRRRKKSIPATETATSQTQTRKKRSGRSKKRAPIDQRAINASIKQTIAEMDGRSGGRRHYSRGPKQTGDTDDGPQKIQVTEFITTQELANLLDVPVQDVIRRGMELGALMSINQRLDSDLIELLAEEYEAEIEFIKEEAMDVEEEILSGADLTPRQPVVTVMGHVDHGKTTLLDYMRHSRVAEGEAGGITQHIGAYEVEYNGHRITFLDTPGHEAFTAMRARGAQVTDIVVLIVAADDRVMPQTVEAIDHARAAEVPIVIAINKVDKPEANVEAIYKQLSDHNILVEKWGGNYQSTEISAKYGQGIDDLLEEIIVAADVLELKADATVRARATVIESRLDKGLGALATLLIQQGTLKIGDIFVVGQYSGKVRSMYGENGEKQDEANPGSPVQVVGFSGVPQAGDRLVVYPTEKEVREISQRRQRQQREMSMRRLQALSLDQINKRIHKGDLKELPLIIKGDVHGSVEVLSDVLMKLSNDEVQVEIIHRGVGGITEADIMLAAASGAIVIGFHVHPNPQAREVARRESVEIRVYRVIHEVIDDVRSSLEGLLAPSREAVTVGHLEIRQVFRISRIGTVAGCYVTDGKIRRNSKVRLIRDDVELWSGELSSLKRFKEDVREVASGFECGLSLAGYSDLRVGDRIEVFEIVETARTLEQSAG